MKNPRYKFVIKEIYGGFDYDVIYSAEKSLSVKGRFYGSREELEAKLQKFNSRETEGLPASGKQFIVNHEHYEVMKDEEKRRGEQFRDTLYTMAQERKGAKRNRKRIA